MAFDPDAYLAEKPQPKGKAFDPDAYLGTKDADKPGPVLATWDEPEPQTGDRPKFIANLPEYEPPVHLEKNPETEQLEPVVGKDKVRATFTDQPDAGQGGRVSARELGRGFKDKERLAKQAFAGGAI